MANAISLSLEEVHQRIADACSRSSRSPEEVRLVCVSKTFPASDIEEAIAAGQRCFGESRLQEAEPKVECLQDGLDWHFIGRVQRNKVRKILPLFQTIHGIDSMKLARYTDRVAGELGLVPQVFLQVNIGREETKGGFDPEELQAQLDELAEFGNLRILGLMCIPPNEEEAEAARGWFVKMRDLRDRLSSDKLPLKELSMGMSGDYELAIEEGATQVRVGSAIFGRRD